MVIEMLSNESVKFIDRENIEAYYYEDIEVVHFIWKKRSVGEEYRKPFQEAHDFSKDRKAKYFISDIREQGIVGPEDRKWFEEEGLSLGIQSGLTKAAIVFEGNVFKLYYLNMILKHFKKKGIPMKFFKTLEEAKNWVLEG